MVAYCWVYNLSQLQATYWYQLWPNAQTSMQCTLFILIHNLCFSEDSPALADPVKLRLIDCWTFPVIRVLSVSLVGMANHPPIPIAQLPDYVAALRANDGEGFSREYESIEPGQPFTWDASTADTNKAKNRYANVVAYDHSRVPLEPLDGADGSDYINANYMDGYCRLKAYIATQVELSLLLLLLVHYLHSSFFTTIPSV